MNVYIGTRGELKNAYIGEVYEYSYDFANKSVSQLQNDWWTFVYIEWNTPPTFSSDWITNWTSVYWGNTVLITRTWISSYIANANKVTLIFTWKTQWWQISHKFYRVANSSTRSDTTWGYIQVTSIYFQDQKSAVYWWIYGESGYENINPSTYNNVMVTQTCVLDFINKTMTITDTLWFSKVLTLTDTQINNIKNNTIYDTIAMGARWTIKSISTIIE